MKKARNPFAPIARNQVNFPWHDVTTALVKRAGLHEGLWQVGFAFNLRAMNVQVEKQFLPAAMAVIEQVVLSRVEKPTPLSVDAAVVNPEKRIVLAVH